MKTIVPKKLLNFFLSITICCLLFACSKNNNGTGAVTHKPSDFQLTVTSHSQNSNSYYNVTYTVKNISNKRYGINEGDLTVKCTIKDQNGNMYQNTRSIGNLDAGSTEATSLSISLASGAVANASSFTAAVVDEGD